MSFLYPHILWGLIAVSLPLIIHLFNFRKFRKVYFTNVRFLEELKQETRKQSKLRHLLVMIARMVAIASLVFAFAQPFIPIEKDALKPEAISQVNIYVDNSFSMEALSTTGPLLERAKKAATEIAASYRSTDLFMLTVNEFEGGYQRWISREEFLQLVAEITVTPAVRKVSEIVARQSGSYQDAPGKARISYLISDFQLTMADFENIKTDSLMTVNLIPLQAARSENLYIDSCWFKSPVHQLNQGVSLMVRIVNDSGTDYEKVPLKLSVNGEQKALSSFDVPSGSFHDVELPYTNYKPGSQAAVVEITDYPVVFDDRMFLVYDVAGSIPVLAVNGQEESIYLNSLYGKDAEFRFVNNAVKNIDYNRLQEYELIILNELDELSSGFMQELAVYLENGGTLLVIPSAKAGMEDFREFFTSVNTDFYSDFTREDTRVTELDRSNPVFADVFERSRGGETPENIDLPVVKAYYGITRNPQSSQVAIMTMQNGKPFLTREVAGKGQIFLLASPLSEPYSNFAQHAIFVPVMYRIALLSAATDPLYYTIGRDTRIELANTYLSGDNTFKIKSVSGDFDFIPGIQNLNKKLSLLLYNQVTTAGHYDLMRGQDIIKGLGFNYNRLESVMKFAGKSELEEMTGRYSLGNFKVIADQGKPLSDAVKDMNRGTVLWRLFIILALVFLALEIVL
jgi:hypothetical protein